MTKSKWKVGQRVCVVSWIGSPILTRCVVKRVLKRFIELDDGSRWVHEGWSYPGNNFPIWHIKEESEKLVQQWWKQKLMAVTKSIDLSGLSNERLLSVIEFAINQLHADSNEECAKVADKVAKGIGTPFI